jgi:hypothetical protein
MENIIDIYTMSSTQDPDKCYQAVIICYLYVSEQ